MNAEIFALGDEKYRWKTVGTQGGATVQDLQRVDEEGRDIAERPTCTCCPLHVAARMLRDAEPWLPEEDAYLRDAARMGRTLRQMSHNLQRMTPGIEARLVALGIPC